MALALNYKSFLIIGAVYLKSLFFCAISHASSTPDAWDALRKQFMLNHEVTRAEVQTQIRWIMAHPTYIQKLAQSEPYIYHIITEIKKRKLPGEIALIPMIESTYDPFAYSGAGAAGLWQLMPGTGTGLGLKQDWWFDGRRSIRPSTDAALNYLTYLHKFFKGNWLLVFAAYDSGEGTIARLIKNSNQRGNVSFWSLTVPEETKAYIPRILALAAVIQHPQYYHVNLPNIPLTPYFQEVNIGSQIDLDYAAQLAGISYKEIIKLNPGYNRWATAPYRPYKLLIPVDKVETFNRNLAQLPAEERVSWARHQVSAGDNLVVIAQKYQTTVNLIKELNQLKSDKVRKGQYILVPHRRKLAATKTPKVILPPTSDPHFSQTSQFKVIHIVQKKDTIKTLQQQYGVSEANIRKWNLLGPAMPLRLGQQLVIWKPTRNRTYIIQKGDTLSSIAQHFHTRVDVLEKLNPQFKNRYLIPGHHLIIDF